MREQLTDENFNRLKEMLVEHVQAETNGVVDLHTKIDETNKKIDAFILKMDPMLDAYINARGFYTTFTLILKFLALVSAGIGAVIFIKKL
jgi:hypothetical protein